MACRAVLSRALRARANPAVRQQVRCLALQGQKPVDGKGEEWITWPYFREGLEMHLNWALNRVNIVPRADAFHNPRQQLLAERLKAKVEGGAVTVPGLSAEGDYPLLEAGSEKLPFELYDHVEKVVQDFFSEPDVDRDLYVASGSAGSYRGATVGVRVITDNPGVCLVAENLLVPAPYIKYENPDSPLPPITFYVTDKLETFAAIEYRTHVPPPGGDDADAASQTLAAIQYKEGEGGALAGATGVLCGAAGASQAALTSAIREVASALLLETEGVVPLPASVLRKGAKTALVFGASPAQLGEAKAAGALYASNGCVLVPGKGVGAMFGGASLPKGAAGTAAGRLTAVVESAATVFLPADNLVHEPAQAFFVGASGTLSGDALSKALAAAKVDADAAERFVAAVAASNMTVTGVANIKAALDKVA